MVDIGKVGVWSPAHLWPANLELARELERDGFGALWLGGSPGGDLKIVEDVLDATSTLVVATGIVNVWADSAATIAAAYHRINAKHPGRFLLGIGASHKMFNDQYERPYAKLVSYLDELDEAKVPADSRVLAALGPKVLSLSAERAAGAHPYLTTPEHTKQAREILGADAVLAPELAVVLESDPAEARAIARAYLNLYLQLPNYTNNFLRLGFTEQDIAGEGGDRLIDAVIPWGGVDAVVAKVAEHHDAGASHVNIQVLTKDNSLSPEGFREIAKALSS